jgi:hypothetical protein
MMVLIGIFPAIAGLITEAKYVQPTAQLLGALLDPLVRGTRTSVTFEPLHLARTQKANHDTCSAPSRKMCEKHSAARAPR